MSLEIITMLLNHQENNQLWRSACRALLFICLLLLLRLWVWELPDFLPVARRKKLTSETVAVPQPRICHRHRIPEAEDSGGSTSRGAADGKHETSWRCKCCCWTASPGLCTRSASGLCSLQGCPKLSGRGREFTSHNSRHKLPRSLCRWHTNPPQGKASPITGQRLCRPIKYNSLGKAGMVALGGACLRGGGGLQPWGQQPCSWLAGCWRASPSERCAELPTKIYLRWQGKGSGALAVVKQCVGWRDWHACPLPAPLAGHSWLARL